MDTPSKKVVDAFEAYRSALYLMADAMVGEVPIDPSRTRDAHVFALVDHYLYLAIAQKRGKP